MSTHPLAERGMEECRDVIRHKSKSFALAARLLPKSSRDDVITLYAWCRRADDAIDLVAPELQTAAVAQLFAEIESVYAGKPQTEPVLQLFSGIITKYQIPKEYPLELVRGMEMDAQGVRYQTLRELLLYCYRVAGVVGLMLCHILGVRSKGALAHAAHLGIAMQLTNISRDVAEDWARGRLYIPGDWLASHEVDPEVGGKVPVFAQGVLKAQVRGMLVLADDYYRSADRGMPALPFRARLAVAAARRVYSAIGTEIRRIDFDVFERRVHVSTLKKLGLCVGAVVGTWISWFRSGSSFHERSALNLPVKAVDDVISV